MAFILIFSTLKLTIYFLAPGPISEANKITMVSNGDGPVGASKLTNEIFNIVDSIPAIVKSMTGVDIKKSEKFEEKPFA